MEVDEARALARLDAAGLRRALAALPRHDRGVALCEALRAAIDRAHVRTLRVLLEAGANPHARWPWAGVARSGMWMAARGDNVAALALLARHGARGGGAELVAAARRGSCGAVWWLLEHGVAVDAVDDDAVGALGRTALAEAAVQGQMAVVRQLCGAGAGTECRDALGWTPLCAVAFAGDIGVLRTLLAHGADACTVTDDCDTPLGLARLGGERDAARVLDEHLRRRERRALVELALALHRLPVLVLLEIYAHLSTGPDYLLPLWKAWEIAALVKKAASAAL